MPGNGLGSAFLADMLLTKTKLILYQKDLLPAQRPGLRPDTF